MCYRVPDAPSSKEASSDEKLSRKRPLPSLTEPMTCALCEQSVPFERDHSRKELVCTCCGAVVEASDATHHPFKLPLPLHLTMPQDSHGSLCEMAALPSKQEPASVGTILGALGLRDTSVSPTES